MPLEVKLIPEKQELLIQENMQLRLELINTGTEAIRLADPSDSNRQPTFRVLETASGETRAFHRRRHSPNNAEVAYTLDPGKQLEWEFMLHDELSFIRPGEYEITTEYEWGDGRGVARSEPIKLILKGFTVQSMALAMTQEAQTEEFYIFWIQQVGGAPWLMRALVNNYDQAKVAGIAQVTQLPARLAVIPSICPNQGNPLDTWIAWLHGGKLHCRLVEMDDVEGEVISTDMPEVNLRLLPHPLLADHNQGEFILWMADRTAKIQLAYTTPQENLGVKPAPHGAFAGGHLALPTADEPLWAQSAFLSSQERRLYLLWRDDKGLALHYTSWKTPSELQGLSRLLQHEGRHLAAGLGLLPDDTVAGVLVVRPEKDAHSLSILRWTHKPDGSFTAQEPETVPFEGADGIDRAIVRLDHEGRPYIALRAGHGKWRLRQPDEGFVELGGMLADTDFPLALFFSRAQRPLFVMPMESSGFGFFEPDGKPAGSTRHG